MSAFLTPLLQFQRFFVPALVILLGWMAWRTLAHKDRAVGLALYASLVVVVDGFYNTGIFIPGFAVGSIRFSEVCALILFFQRDPKTGPAARPSYGAALFLVGLYFLLLAISAVRADPMSAGIFDFRRIIVPQIIAFALALRGLESAADYRRFFLCLGALALLVGTFSFWDVFFDRWILHSDMLFKPEYTHNRKIGRFGSIFLNPNLLGAFVVLFFAPLAVMALKERHRWWRLYIVAVLLALVFSLIQTQSRGPILAFGGLILVMLLGPAGGISRKQRIGGLLILVTALAVFMPGFLKRSTERFETTTYEQVNKAASRETIWAYTRDIIADHPLAGIGFGEKQFLSAMATTDFHAIYSEASLDNPHNSYLQAAVYAGIPALIIFVMANLVLLGRSMAAIRREKRGAAAAPDGITFGLAAGLTGFLIAIYPDMHLFTPNVAPLYWLFFGLLLSLVVRKTALNAPPPPSGPRQGPQGPKQSGGPRRIPVVTARRRSLPSKS